MVKTSCFNLPNLCGDFFVPLICSHLSSTLVQHTLSLNRNMMLIELVVFGRVEWHSTLQCLNHSSVVKKYEKKLILFKRELSGFTMKCIGIAT